MDTCRSIESDDFLARLQLERGIIEPRSRSATARATADSSVEVMTAQEFLDRVSADPARARAVILRLGIRLRNIEDKIAGALLPFTPERISDRRNETASDAINPYGVTVALTAWTDALRARIGASPIPVPSLPYVVGRLPVAREVAPPRRPARSYRRVTHSGSQPALCRWPAARRT